MPVFQKTSGILGNYRPSHRWVMISFAFLATLLNYLHRLSFNYLAADEPLNSLVSDQAFGFIATAFFIAYMISNGVSGFVIDRLGTRLGYSLCMAVWTTAGLLHALARIPLHFGIFRFLLGVGEAGNWPAAIKLSGEWFKPVERSTASGIFNSGSALGSVIAPPLIAWLGTSFGWRATFIVIGMTGYVWLVLFWFTYYTPEKVVREASGSTIPPLKLMKTRFVSWFTASKVFMDAIWYFITFWIGKYLVAVHGFELKDMFYAALPFIFADFGNILGGLFTQMIIKWGIPVHRARKISVAIFGSLMILALALAPVLIDGPAMALGILAVAGFGWAAYTANTMAFPPDVVPASATASVWGLASVGAGLGGAVFQSVSGITVEKLQAVQGYEFAYNSIFVGYAVLGIIGLSIVLFLMGPILPDKSLARYAVRDDDPEDDA